MVPSELSAHEARGVIVRADSVCQFTGYRDDTLWEELTPEEQKVWLEGHSNEEWQGLDIYDKDLCLCWTSEDEEPYESIITRDGGAFVIDVKRRDYDVTPIGWAIEGGDICKIVVQGSSWRPKK